MDLIAILKSVLIVSLWSSVIAFIPISLYLIMKGVEETEKNRVSLKTVFTIFGICFLVYYLIYIGNSMQGTPEGFDSVTILSSMSIVSFWFSVIIYMPLAIFQGLRYALHSRAKATVGISCLIFVICLLIACILYGIYWMEGIGTGFKLLDLATAVPLILLSSTLLAIIPILLFAISRGPKPDTLHEKRKQNVVVMCLIYGGFLLIFSIIYSYNWMRNIEIDAHPFDIALLLLNLLYATAIVSFLPIQFYVMMKIGMHRRNPRASVIFAIYCVSFVFFAGVYIFQWLENKKQGIEHPKWDMSIFTDNFY